MRLGIPTINILREQRVTLVLILTIFQLGSSTFLSWLCASIQPYGRERKQAMNACSFGSRTLTNRCPPRL